MPESAYHPLYLRGVEQFNRRQFFESHELWEQLWLEVDGRDRLFYKGLIQAAVALFHLNNGNAHGARKLLAGARRYLGPYGSPYLGLDLDDFLSALSRCVEKALADRGEAGEPLVDPRLVPEIRLQPVSQQRPDVR